MLIPSMRDDERRETFSAFVTLFAFMTGFALLETARDALFLGTLPASRLAAAYLVIALITLTLTRLDRVLFERFAAGNELRYSLLLAGAVTGVFWVLAESQSSRVVFALYIWTGVVATLVVVRFWTALGARFTVEQAKRLFAFIGSGSVLGAIVGSFVARLLSEIAPPQTMLFFAAAAFLVSGLVSAKPVAAASPVEPDELPRQNWDPREVVELVWSRPYLRRVAIVVLTASVTFTLVDFLFKSTVDRLVAPVNMGEVFSSIYLGLHILSLVVQLTLVSPLVRRLGVNHAQAAVPLFLAVGAGAFALSGALVFALAVKVIDGGLRHSLYRTTSELLFVPVTGELRARVKTFIDVLGQRGGQALASLAILGLLSLGAGDVVIAFTVVAVSVAWLGLALALRKHYLNVFRETLGDEITETRVRFPTLDLASMKTLLATLSDGDERRVLASLDMLAEQGKVQLVPGSILTHPSPAVVLRAIDLFREEPRPELLQIVDELAQHPDENVRAATLPVSASVRASAWREGLEDPSSVVRATALVGVAAAGVASRAELAEIDAVVECGPEKARAAVAVALHDNAAPRRADLLCRLAATDDLEVRRAALHAMRAHPDPSFVDALIPLLTDRSLREDVRQTLVLMGPDALAELARALEAPTSDYAVRRRLPKTIGLFQSDEAASILLGRFLDESDGLVRFKILSALGRMQRQRPELRLDDNILERAFDGSAEAAMTLSEWRRTLETASSATAAHSTSALTFLVNLMRHKQRHALERLFRLINLQQPSDDLPRIFRGLQSSERQTLASSRELAENLLAGSRKDVMLGLIDDIYSGVSTELPADGPSDDDDREPSGLHRVLGELFQCSSETLSALATYHAGEVGAVELLPQIRAARGKFSSRHDVVVDQALARLSDVRESEAGRAR